MTMTGFNHSVTWGDLRTVPSRRARVPEDAFIKADRRVSYDFSGTGRSYRITGVTAEIVVNRSRSWVVQGRQDTNML